MFVKNNIIAFMSLCFLAFVTSFILTLKTWSFGPGQSFPALPEESLQEFEVN